MDVRLLSPVKSNQCYIYSTVGSQFKLQYIQTAFVQIVVISVIFRTPVWNQECQYDDD